MKTQFRAIFAVGCILAAVGAYSQNSGTGLSGVWVTDAVLTASSSGGGGGFGGGSRPRACEPGGIDPHFVICPGNPPVRSKDPDGPALAMTLMPDKKEVGGEVYDAVKKEKLKIEEGRITGANTFEFKIFKKVGDIRIATIYKGGLTDATTITLQRFKLGGDALDKNVDGTPVTAVFHRAPSIRLPPEGDLPLGDSAGRP